MVWLTSHAEPFRAAMTQAREHRSWHIMYMCAHNHMHGPLNEHEKDCLIWLQAVYA